MPDTAIQTPNDQPRQVSTARRVLGGLLDFITVMAVAGYAIAYATGGLTDSGFDLKGGPAFVLFAVVVTYFVIGYRFAGGTIWQRILRIR